VYLLDTVVISTLRQPRGDPGLRAWVRGAAPDSLFLSIVALFEVTKGIDRVRARDPMFAANLERWLQETETLFAGRILDVDARIARRWGRLAAALGHEGPDLIVAATALEHGLTVVTRNVRHFASTGVNTLNPFSAA
jgi:hypothetical protein